MKKSNSYNILKKYSKKGIDNLPKVVEGAKIREELCSVSWQDIESLTQDEFNSLSLPLLYDWCHISANYTSQEQITKLAIKNRHSQVKNVLKLSSTKDKFEYLKDSELYCEQLENIAKEIVAIQKASISTIQRLFSIPYPKAQAYIDELLALGFIEKNDRYYKVLVSEKEI